MKAIKILATAAFTLAAISCSKEIVPDSTGSNLVQITLNAKSESCDEDTKAVFKGYPKIAWEVGDAISLLGSKTGNQMFTSTVDALETTFTGSADRSDEVYYAVYPYDAAVTLNQDGTIGNVTVPAVQKATAGSFDPDAYIAIAESKDKKNLEFKAIGGIIKLNFQNFTTGIKSVTLVSNAGSIMAGTAQSTYIEDGGTSHSKIVSGTGSTSIKLEGEFNLTKAYFMIVRPAPYEGGVTVYIELEDGRILSRRGESALFEKGMSRNYIRAIILDQNKFNEVNDIYSLYEMGYDIKVGNYTFNKATSSAEVLTAAEENTDIYAKINSGGIYFLETTGNGSFCFDSNAAVTKDVVLIGKSGKVKIKMNGKNIYHKSNILAMKNIEIDATDNKNYVIAITSTPTADTEAFILDNCSVTGLTKPLYYVADDKYTCKSIYFIDTDVSLAEATNIIDLNKTKSVANKAITFKNCILAGASNYVSRIVNNSANLTEYSADLVFENNTVFNLHAGTNNGLLHMVGAKSVSFKNNLVNFFSVNANEYIIYITDVNTTYEVDNNYFWARSSNGIPTTLTFYSNIKVEPASIIISDGNYPYTSKIEGAGATR